MQKSNTPKIKPGVKRRTVLKEGVRLSALVATLGVSVGVDFSSVQAASAKKKVVQDKFKRSKGVRQNKLSPGSRAIQDKALRSRAIQDKALRPKSRAIQDKALRSRTIQDKSSRTR